MRITKPLQPITVSDLIEFLQTQPQDILVAYKCCSEQALLELDEIEIIALCEPGTDGWIQNKRPDKPTQNYLLFPG